MFAGSLFRLRFSFPIKSRKCIGPSIATLKIPSFGSSTPHCTTARLDPAALPHSGQEWYWYSGTCVIFTAWHVKNCGHVDPCLLASLLMWAQDPPFCTRHLPTVWAKKLHMLCRTNTCHHHQAYGVMQSTYSFFREKEAVTLADIPLHCDFSFEESRRTLHPSHSFNHPWTLWSR